MSVLGTITGQVRLDVRQAVAAYAVLRAQNARTVYALRGTGDTFVRTGQTMAVAGAGLVYVFGQAVQAAAEFERKMDFFSAVSDTSSDKMRQLSDFTLQLAADTIYSADQVADGFIELAKAGVSADQIIRGIGEAMTNLGAAGDIPLAESGQIITSTIQQFDKDARDAVEVVDLLAGAANASIADITDIGVSLKYVGGVANAAGLSFEDTATAISLLAKAGIRGSTAGTSLRQMIVSLGGATGPARETMKELGIITEDGANKFFTAEGKAKSLAEVFQILQDHTSDLTQKERLMALRTIFNNRALSAASILTREGAAGFREMNREMSKTSAAEVASERLDNLSGDIEILRGNIQTMMIEAGSPFQEMLRGWVQDLTALIQAYNNLDPETQKFIAGAIGISGVGLLVMGAFSLVIGTIARFLINLKRLRESFGFLKRAMGIGGSGAKGLGIIGTVSKFLKGAGLVGILLTAADAFVKLREKFDWYKRTSDEFFRGWGKHGLILEGSVYGIAQAWDELNRATGNAPNDAIGWIKDLPGQVGSFFEELPGKARTSLDELGDEVQQKLDDVVGYFEALPGRILGVVSSTMTRVAGYFTLGNAAHMVGLAIQGIVRWFVVLPALVMTHVLRFVDLVLRSIGRLGPRVAYVVGFMVGRVVRFFAGLASRVMGHVAVMVGGVIRLVQSLPSRVGAFISSLVSRVVGGFQRARTEGPKLVGRMVVEVLNFFQRLPGRVATFMSQLVRRVTEFFSRLPTIARQKGSELAVGFITAINGLPGLVTGVIDEMIGAFTGAIRSAYNAARDMAGGLWQGFKDGIGMNSPSLIERAVWQITGVLDEETKKMARQTMNIQKLSKKLASTPLTVGSSSGYRGVYDLAMREASNRDRAQRLMAASLTRSTRDDRRGDEIGRSRLIEGRLGIDPSGQAYLRGVAQDAVADGEDYEYSIERMG